MLVLGPQFQGCLTSTWSWCPARLVFPAHPQPRSALQGEAGRECKLNPHKNRLNCRGIKIPLFSLPRSKKKEISLISFLNSNESLWGRCAWHGSKSNRGWWCWSRGSLSSWGAQTVPWQLGMTPLHTSGGGRCSQDKAPLASGGSVMILPSRISLCWRLSDDLHQVCSSLEPGQGKVPKNAALFKGNRPPELPGT